MKGEDEHGTHERGCPNKNSKKNSFCKAWFHSLNLSIRQLTTKKSNKKAILTEYHLGLFDTITFYCANMRNAFLETDYRELVVRINELTEGSKRKWGKMEVAQMLAHCCLPLKQALTTQYHGSGNLLLKLIFKKKLYDDSPHKKNLPTAKQFIINDSRDFETEKNNLLALLREVHKRGIAYSWGNHPTFGVLTPEQWGMSFYKHLDHHLQQFGV